MKYRRYIFKRDNDKKAAILPLFIFTYTNVPSQVSVTFLKYCKFSFASASLNKLSCFIISVANSTYADPTAVIIFPSTVTSLFCLYSHSCKCANCFSSDVNDVENFFLFSTPAACSKDVPAQIPAIHLFYSCNLFTIDNN